MNKNQKNNRPKSKNNPNGKPNEPKVDWKDYDRRCKAEGTDRKARMRKLEDVTYEVLGVEKDVPDRRVGVVMAAYIRTENNLTYRGLVNHFVRYPSDLELCGLKKIYQKSWYQLRISQIDPKVVERIVTRLGEDDADGPLMVDSTGEAVLGYKSWTSAKYGKSSKKDYYKLHIIQKINGKICATRATNGEANDSPILREMLSDIRPGTGDVTGDKAYCGKENCEAIRASGRTPILMPKSNSVISGTGAYADMLRSLKEHPGTFYKKFAMRNNVESTFASMKKRFGSVIRAKKHTTRVIELLFKPVCYNMIA